MLDALDAACLSRIVRHYRKSHASNDMPAVSLRDKLNVIGCWLPSLNELRNLVCLKWQIRERRPSMETILTAILNDDRPRVKKLLKADPRLATSLIDEARLYQSKIVHWIYAGDTALHLAAAGYRVELVQLLLAAGADPNSTANHRQSGPLHYAADGYINGPDWNAKRQVETIQSLLDAGAKINAQDKNGAAPLHRAVRTRCAAAVKYLLERGCDTTLKNKPGSTPFHLAVQDTGHGGTGAEEAKAAQRQIIHEFLSFGLSPALKDSKGKSVLDWARSAWIRNILSGNATDPG